MIMLFRLVTHSVSTTLGLKGTFSQNHVISFFYYCYKRPFAMRMWPIHTSWVISYSWAEKAYLLYLVYVTSPVARLFWLKSLHDHLVVGGTPPVGWAYLAHSTANHITNQTCPQQPQELWADITISCLSNIVRYFLHGLPNLYPVYWPFVSIYNVDESIEIPIPDSKNLAGV